MRNNDLSKSFDYTVRDALTTIKATHIRLHLLNGACSTAASVASQIELYDVLLDELSGIHISLASYLEHARTTPSGFGRAGLNA